MISYKQLKEKIQSQIAGADGMEMTPEMMEKVSGGVSSNTCTFISICMDGGCTQEQAIYNAQQLMGDFGPELFSKFFGGDSLETVISTIRATSFDKDHIYRTATKNDGKI